MQEENFQPKQYETVRNLSKVHEATISPRDIDDFGLVDENGNLLGKAARVTVAMPGHHPSIKEMSFMLPVGGRIEVMTYSASEATRYVARVFNGKLDTSGTLLINCPGPLPKPPTP